MPRVNLVPQDERRREIRRQLVILPVAGAIVVLGVLGGSYYYLSNKQKNTEQDLNFYKDNNARQAAQVEELQKYEDIKSQKQARLGAVTSVYQSRFRWSRMLDDMSFVIPESISLIKVTGKVPGTTTTTEKKASSEEGIERDLEFEGYTNSMPEVAVFMVRLGLIPTLTDVSLKLAESEEINGPVHFIINASLKSVGETQRPALAPTTGESGPAQVTPTTGTTTSPTTTGRASTTATGAEE